MPRCDGCRTRYPVVYELRSTVVLCYGCWVEWESEDPANIHLDDPEDVEGEDEEGEEEEGSDDSISLPPDVFDCFLQTLRKPEA